MERASHPIWTATGPERRLTQDAVELLIEALSDDICSLKPIRSDSRIKIYKGVGLLTPRLAPFTPAPSQLSSIKNYCVSVTLYITRPKALKLSKGQFHILALFGISTAYAFISNVILKPMLPDSTILGASFYDASAIPLPKEVPDPTAELITCDDPLHLDVSMFATPAQPPDQRYDCCVLAPGVWWSYRECSIYYLCMDTTLLALCPSGWRCRSLCGILARLLNHREGCGLCQFEGHVDALNASSEPSNIPPESCLCWAPCLWRKAGQRDLPVEGDHVLFRVLFMDAVDRIRLPGSPRNPKITNNISDVISGIGSDGRQIPANGAGWNLVVLDENITKALICSCVHLRRLCMDSPPSDNISTTD
nr:tegument protein UL16 [Felid alphaherpesvirus 1]